MRGWFDAFRSEGGPTLYSYSNRTPVTGDPPTIALYVLFASLGIAFLIIFPGIRKERFTTFWSVVLSLFVGSSILVSQYGSAWQVGEVDVSATYRAFSKERVQATIGVHIGLTHVNVTFQNPSSSLLSNESKEDIDFNERFHWEEPDQIQREFRSALQKGLPFPILTVVEYFSLDEAGFAWGRHYREAGYYAGILLWYGAYQMVLTGTLLLLTDLTYLFLLPAKLPIIRFEGAVLQFRMGTSFWTVMAGSVVCLVAGTIIAVVDLLYPHKFSTVLEVDYDTPYDRHIIIEESHDTRKKKAKRSLEEPDGIGKRILRTLSSRGGKGDDEGNDHGHPNEAFQMDPPIPNSPWRHPHGFPIDRQNQLRGTLASAFSKNPALLRLAAPNPRSPKSVSFRRQSGLETTYPLEDRRKDSSSSSDLPLEEPSAPFQFRAVERTESMASRISSASSFGLGLLSRQPSQVHQQTSRKKQNASRHMPLQRVTHLPRPTLNRHSSTEESRRDSGSSNNSIKDRRDW